MEEEDLILIQLNLKTKQYLNLDPRHDLYNLRSLLMETIRVVWALFQAMKVATMFTYLFISSQYIVK